MIDSSQSQTDNSIIEKYCYSNDPNNCTIYGGLYQWAEAVQYQNGATNTTTTSPALTGNVQGICPTGWHLPSEAELSTLVVAVDTSGNALKAIGQGDLEASGDGRGNNKSGFSALLSGYRTYLSNFFYIGLDADFWTSTETSAYYSNDLLLYHNYDIFDWSDPSFKLEGLNVRCIKD
jgi:uncharacterized protein (TIGR02145 family)